MAFVKTISYNGKDGWITKSADSPQDRWEDSVEVELPEGVEPADPSSVEKAPRWTGSEVVVEETGTNNSPEPSEAMRQIVAYYASLNQDADDPTKAGRIQLNQFTSSYPSAQMALQSGEYDELTGPGGYFEIAVEDTDLADFDSAMRSDIEDILAGKTSYL